MQVRPLLLVRRPCRKTEMYTIGRSVEVNGDIAHALNKLKTILKNNYVRPEWLAQKRHEKKGNRRRRLASLRWRRRFSYEVRMFCSCVVLLILCRRTTPRRFRRRSSSSTPFVRGVHDVYIFAKFHRSLLFAMTYFDARHVQSPYSPSCCSN